jgi:hypothetical protein
MVLAGESFPDAKAQVAAEVTCEPRMLLKPSGTEAAPVSVLVSFATVRERSRRTGPGRRGHPAEAARSFAPRSAMTGTSPPRGEAYDQRPRDS